MKNVFGPAVAGLLLIGFTGVTFAQTTVVVSPEHETVIREYVKKKPLASISVPGVELNIGTALPETVELHTIDAPDVKYRYVVVDNRTVLVEPETRKIIRILD
jgi:hypothetical protein